MIRVLVVLSMMAIARAADYSPLWPMPVVHEVGRSVLELGTGFRFVSKSNAVSERLNRAMDRYTKLVGVASARKLSHLKDTSKIEECAIVVSSILSPSAEEASLDLDVNESYTLSVQENGNCEITSETVWGAFHGMETFTQLLTREDGGVVTRHAPIQVQDKPRYSHRGVLIDSARHYLPVDSIKRVIETLPMTKMNVLHWHAVDAQSFPVDTPSAPDMKKGAYGDDIYSMDDIRGIKDFAIDRGVRIIFEFDGPGHAASWGKGYPEILADCRAKYWYNVNNLALNPVLDKTYDIVAAIFKDVVTATSVKYLHLGGDEVVYGCWAADAMVVKYMEDNGITDYADLLNLYVGKANEIATDLGVTTIFWEDTFLANVRPPKSSIFDVWTNSEQIANVTSAGYRVIAAPSDYWYLDHADNTWLKMYTYEPTTDLSEHAKSLIIGGEASMWGEMVDETNIIPKIWPTAAAVGERLWSVQAFNSTPVVDANLAIGDDDQPNIELEDANQRLLMWRCRMIQRGYAVSPIQPSYCPVQYV